MRVHQVMTERFHARRVTQIETEDLETMRPLLEIGLGGVACGRVAREARGHNETSPRPQQLDAGLIADLHSAAGKQGGAPREVGQLATLAVVELGAGGAELIVEVVQHGEVALAHVAMLLFQRLAEVGIRLDRGLLVGGRQQIVGRREHRLAAQAADAGFLQLRLGLLHADSFLDALLPLGRLDHLASQNGVGARDFSGRLEQAIAIVVGDLEQLGPVHGELFEQLGRGKHTLGQAEAGFRGVRTLGHSPES